MKAILFLLRRPIAVTMTFVAIVLLGVATFGSLPVSMLPSIPIPEINIQTTGTNMSAQQIEQSVTEPLRRQLLQTGGLKEITSHTLDGVSNIKMKFDFGTDINLAFIEANEKIDAVASQLPEGIERPRAVKASATDIPVLYINMTLRHNAAPASADTEEKRFMDMCGVAQNVVQRRIEQLAEVAMTDMTGVPQKAILLRPDLRKMQMAGVSNADLRTALAASNINPGTMTVRDGYYEYDIHVGNEISSIDDVRNVYISKNGRLFQIKDFCQVGIGTAQTAGMALMNGQRAVMLAVIKQGNANMADLKEQVRRTIDTFGKAYPDIQFTINRNQTELLDYTISSLEQNFIIAFLLMFVAALLFMGDVRSPLVVGVCMAEAVVLTFLFFFVFDISLNTISLSGMVLVIGMMVDNALIVTENISQHRERGDHLLTACARGTAEMVTPMLSSSLTTVVVFVPLVFMSDVAGALFADEARSITLGLLSSYIVAVLLLPVVYMLSERLSWANGTWNRTLSQRANQGMTRLYDRGIDHVFAHRKVWLALTLLTLPACAVLFADLRKEMLPDIEQSDTMAHIDWNDNIDIQENARRTQAAIKAAGPQVVENVAEIGVQDYLLGTHNTMTPNEADVYLRTGSREQMLDARQRLRQLVSAQWPDAQITFSTPDNIFDKVFSSSGPDIVAEVRSSKEGNDITMPVVNALCNDIISVTGQVPTTLPGQRQVVLNVDMGKAMLYGVSIDDIVKTFTTAFRNSTATTLKASHQNMPVTIVGDGGTVNQFLSTAMVPSTTATGTVMMPVSAFVSAHPSEGLKTIVAGKNGAYIPFQFERVDDKPALVEKLDDAFRGNRHEGWTIDFSGSYFEGMGTIRQLALILLVSVLLMYFILCAQFESFLQPLVVLMEIPIDTSLAMVVLWLCGYSLNLMSAIGIIASCGIVVNDSILKLDTINHLRHSGMPLLAAVHEAGHRRLRAIVMTSLTTIAGMVPFFLASDMGSELQRSLAVAMTAAIFFGTMVSLFIVPLIYCAVVKDKRPSQP